MKQLINIQSREKLRNDIETFLNDAFDISAGGVTSTIGTMMSETLLGQALPGVTSVVLAYKQKRAEKNLERFIAEVKEKEESFNHRLNNLKEEIVIEFREKYFGIVTDYVLDEVQEEKIKYITKGLYNLSAYETIQEDFVLTYYDTLKELRLIDIAVLQIYDYSNLNRNKTYEDILKEFNVEYDQYEAVREKLVRIGLLQTKREAEIDNLFANVIEIYNYLETLNKGKNAKISRMKNLSKSDSYTISKFGRDFLLFFVASE